MGIGVLLFFSLAKGKKWLNLLNKDIVVFSSIVLSFGLWFGGFKLKYFTDEFYSILFRVMILGVVRNPKVNIDTKILRFFGNISYGIYVPLDYYIISNEISQI